MSFGMISRNKNMKIKQNFVPPKSQEKYCVEICVGLLQDFFASASPHRMHKKNLLPKCAVHYSNYLKLNDSSKENH